MNNTKSSIDIFLLCFISMIGIWFVYHGVFAVNHYDLNNHLMGKFPIDEKFSSLAGDFAYPYNGANNFIDSNAGVYSQSKCYLPTTMQCYNFGPTPFVPLAFSAFAELPYYISYRVYLILVLTLWAGGIYTLAKMQPKMQLFDTKYLSLFIAIVLLSSPFHYEFERGNWHSLIFLSVLLSFYLQNWKNDVISSAFLITFAMWLKIHPGLFIVYFFIKGHFRTTFYATLFSICFFYMSGGPEVYGFYTDILKNITANMSIGGGWYNHSTSSMLSTIIDFKNNSAFKLLIAYIISGSFIVGTFFYIFYMGRNSNPTLLKIEFALVLILANITTVTASRYSLIYIPFVMLAIMEALDSKAIKEKFNKYWVYFAWVIAILACYTLMSPLARGDGDYNIISDLINIKALVVVRQLWFTIMILFFLLIYFHWQIAKADPQPKRASSLISWYETDLSQVLSNIKNLAHSFQLSELINLLDPVEYRFAPSIVITRICVIFLFVYLLYYSIIGSIIKP